MSDLDLLSATIFYATPLADNESKSNPAVRDEEEEEERDQWWVFIKKQKREKARFSGWRESREK